MKFIALVTAALLAGCAVVPIDPQVSVGITARINYPVSVSAYVYDPSVRLYYFVDGGNRYYMSHGWHPRHGIPPGHYRGKKNGGKWKHD